MNSSNVCSLFFPFTRGSSLKEKNWHSFHLSAETIFGRNSPAGTWRLNDALLTSMRRDDVASTSVRHQFDVMWPLEGHQGRRT